MIVSRFLSLSLSYKITNQKNENPNHCFFFNGFKKHELCYKSFKKKLFFQQTKFLL